MVGMSKAALERCRSLIIKDEGTKDNFLTRLSIIDPSLNDKEIVFYPARSQMDVDRVKGAWIRKYRVPLENITVIERKKSLEEIVVERKKLDQQEAELEAKLRKEAVEQAAAQEDLEDFIPEKFVTPSGERADMPENHFQEVKPVKE